MGFLDAQKRYHSLLRSFIASSEQCVDNCSLHVPLRGSQYELKIGLDWPRLINGVALVDGRSVVFSAKRGRQPDFLIVVGARVSSVDFVPQIDVA